MLTVHVDVSDLRKVRRALELAEHAQRATDEANAARHCALDSGVIHSPLTTLLRQEIDRVDRLIDVEG